MRLRCLLLYAACLGIILDLVYANDVKPGLIKGKRRKIRKKVISNQDDEPKEIIKVEVEKQPEVVEEVAEKSKTIHDQAKGEAVEDRDGRG